MIKQYISLLELVPVLIEHAKGHAIFKQNVDRLYSAQTELGNTSFPTTIVIPDCAETCELEYDAVRIGNPSHNRMDNASYTPPAYNIPHILELEYMQQKMEFSLKELTMLHKMSVLLLLQRLIVDSDEYTYIDSNNIIDPWSNSIIAQDIPIHAIDTEEHPEMVEDTLLRIYREYDANAHTPNNLQTAGIGQSTKDIHNAFDGILNKDGTTRTQAICYCLRYMPLYVTFALLEEHAEDIKPTYAEFKEYCDLYTNVFSDIPNGSQFEPFSNGRFQGYYQPQYSDARFISRIMDIAINTMKNHISQTVIPCDKLDYRSSIELIENADVSVLLTYPTLDW